MLQVLSKTDMTESCTAWFLEIYVEGEVFA